MRGTPHPRRTAASVALGLTALVIVGAYLGAPDDARRPLVVNLIDAVAWFMGGVVLLGLAAPRILIPRDRYVVDMGSAPPTYLYEALEAPPLAPVAAPAEDFVPAA